MSSRGAAQRGFTLLEMMIAMGILAVSYVALLQAQSGSIRLSAYGKQITIATFLAQAHLEEVEETLTKEGFPDMEQQEEGDFEELGHPSFKWRLAVRKVELPLASAFESLLGKFGSGAEGEGGAQGPLAGLGDLESMLGGQVNDQLKGQLGNVLGGGGAGMAGMINPDMLKGQVDMLTTMLEEALREVQLTVWWAEGGPGKELILTTHLVQVPQAGGLPGAGQPGLPGAGGPADPLKGFIDPAARQTLDQKGTAPRPSPTLGPTTGTGRGKPIRPGL